ncbi:ligand-binding sensor domain-containing diguanylate cyclase [Massilia glaciei]|uniref:diguanylate cyclase n=1 Tax=Massilia glaciei TaxID=1524097 RepID=A0A2U2HPB0_9BURK|nr:ligand-binding sensor domain-containing diguanylate cyclase [Massilia glaciei]PWF49347.1 GGDEF domain-containing protein [Massilia glaciei]
MPAPRPTPASRARPQRAAPARALFASLLASLLAMFALASLLAAAPALALDPTKSFHHYVQNAWSIQEGLPQISVQAIVQDQQGYIWVGTQAGLARFDGVRFTTYTPDNEPAVPGVWIRSLLVDTGGRIWIGTYKGIAVFHNGKFSRIPVADPGAFPSIDVHAMLQDGDGLIAATTDGLFDLVDGKLVHRAGGPAPAQSILRRADGLWVGTLGAVVRLDNQGGRRDLPLPAEAATATVTRLADAQGRIWAGTTLGLYLRDGDHWRLATSETALSQSPTTMLMADRDDNLWVGSNAGLARMRGGLLAEFIPAASVAAFKGVIAAYEDREHNLWLGSQWQGLARLWNGWTRRYGAVEGLQEPIVWSVARAPDGRTWVGTNDGLSVFDQGRYTQVVPGDKLPHPQAYNLLAEADTIWIGTRRGLVLWRDGRVEAPPQFAPMAAAQINGIVRARDGTIWIPTSDGLFRFRDEVLTRFGQAEGLTDVRLRQVRELRDGLLLVGTQDGLFEFEDGRLARVGLGQGLPAGIDVTALLELPGGELVIGTLSEQIFMFDGKRWTEFSSKQGLPPSAPFFLTGDGNGFLWAAGLRGLVRVPLADMRRLQRGEIATVPAEMVLNERGDRHSGQQAFCCNGAGNSKGFIDAAGTLWLPTRDGVVTLDTGGVTKNRVVPKVAIERVQYLGKWHDVDPTTALNLANNARDLAFEFTVLSFQDPKSVVVRFRLRGYDTDWRELPAGVPRAVNYTNLPAGDYTFEVKASNNAGVWSEAPAAMVFSISPHFYETGLFYALLALSLGALVYAGYRRQRRLHNLQRVRLEELVAERTQQLNTAILQLEHASQTDPLTGLHNRRYLSNQLPADLAFYDREYARTGSSEHALLFALVDIDHFKRINDTYGHKAGDIVLQQFAEVLTSLARVGDYIVRWGGEEFLLVFRPVPRRFVNVLGERIRSTVAGRMFDVGEDLQVPITCSVGLSEYGLFRAPKQRVGWEQMIELADAALYWVKENGRDGWAALRPTEHADLEDLIAGLHTGVQPMLDGGRLGIINSRDYRAPEGEPAEGEPAEDEPTEDEPTEDEKQDVS